MSALEQEIKAKFRLLDKPAQQRIREFIEQETERNTAEQEFDFAAWAHEIEAMRGEIRSAFGGRFPYIDVVGMLREIRNGEDDE